MAPQDTQNTAQDQTVMIEFDSCTEYGKLLANAPPGEEVVISGISGCFPDSKDVYEFGDNLYNKVDMVSSDTRRWKPTHPEIPQRTGKMKDVEKFDAGYFGIHYRQAHSLDPGNRIILEKTVEAILDAGLSPSDLEGTNTGVYIGACFTESEKAWFHDILEPSAYGITGCERSMIPNRISYFLKLNGPSVVIDTACSSSLYALEHAFRAIRNGLCDRALVGGTNLCLHPFVSLQFARLGVLSKDGSCKVFDAAGNGYARSEGSAIILLEKAKVAKRVYAKIIHAKTNCDGFKETGITFPSREAQERLLKDFYVECGIDQNNLSFLEAHGTGTKVGDPEECTAIDEAICKKRKKPLLVGSVKSNIGHTEPTSGMCSLAKIIIAVENGYIPPNLYYSTPRPGVKALEEGRLKVVTEKMPFEDKRGLIGVNSFGFGGSNCHILLQWNPKEKINGGSPKDDLPRLVCVSGRVEEAIHTLLNDVGSRKLDAEYVGLLQESFRKHIVGHLYRGYSILTKSSELKRSSKLISGEEKQLCFAFGDFFDNWRVIGKKMMNIPLFSAVLQMVNNILLKKGISVVDKISSTKTNGTVLEKVLGSLAIQIGMADVLRLLELKPSNVFGHSFGEIVCGYVSGTLTLEETVLVTYTIANSVTNLTESSFGCIIHLKEAEVRKMLPAGTAITVINSNEATTICGSVEAVKNLINNLKSKKIVFEEIGPQLVNFNGKTFAALKPSLIKQLSKILSKPKPISSSWMMNSSAKSITPEFILSIFTDVISFKDLTRNIHHNSVILEIGTGKIASLNKSLDQRIQNVNIEDSSGKDYVVKFLDCLGRMYELGYNPQISNLYPKIDFPVPRGTPMVAPQIRWKHSNHWYVMYYKPEDNQKTGEKAFHVCLSYDWHFISGHEIDGRVLFPATGYLVIVWETLAAVKGMFISDMQVVFENVRFLRATHIASDNKYELLVMLQAGSGNFEVIEGGMAIVTGRISTPENFSRELVELAIPEKKLKRDQVLLSTKDIYKELRLRGYAYKGAFRNLKDCDINITKAIVKWDGNWISLMDNMLQMKILEEDTRLLYVPTSIERVVIDAKFHVQHVISSKEENYCPVYHYKDSGIIKSGGIEIRGIIASSIPRRKPRGDPVLEKYLFVPNITNLTPEQSMRVNVQLAIDNGWGIRVKVIEVLDEEIKGQELLGPIIFDVFCDLPLIQPEITVLTKQEMEVKNIGVEDRKLVSETECNLVIATGLFRRTIILQQALGALKEEGFVISREPLDMDISSLNLTGVDILTVHSTETEKLVMFRKNTPLEISATIKIESNDETFSWISTLQTAIKKENSVVIYSQNEPTSGILGLSNCLRREPGGSKIKSVFIIGDAPEFHVSNPLYLEQLKKNLSTNVYKDGVWGTYRHLLLEDTALVESEHCFVNVTTRGDLGSLKWIEGPLKASEESQEQTLVHVYYSALNFRDIMTASGRINADAVTRNRLLQECVQGFEFAGRDNSGRRVFGMIISNALATLVQADSFLLWRIPDHWSMEDAATVPAAYGTVLYAMIYRAHIKKGETILIHCGSGGVGQAAIVLALHLGCTVYTTVGSEEKRDFIKKRFPQLNDRRIGNSRDTSFEKFIITQTKGRGVDVVLNSLAEEKLEASVRCLARGGRFIEIGKYDLMMNNRLQLMFFEKEASFHGIMLDQLFTETPCVKKNISDILEEFISNDVIRPLNKTVFKDDEIETAFRYMATGKHTGKILIKIRKEEIERNVPPTTRMCKGIPRYFCNPENSYIIVGGLGGIGLELADWLILRGARKLVLTSRAGPKNGYQLLRMKTWKRYGSFIKVSTVDVTTRSGCEQLIQEANELGPVEAIFNLAVVLKDALLENQTPEMYLTSFGPKAIATKHLDEVSRELCPNLRDFVIFSSVSCGRGNPGQTNYGMANSIMERICERRKNDGYPALAIEWGAIGEVGLVAEMQEEHVELEIGGTIQQKISSCLQVMDIFLRQSNPIVASMVVAEKRRGAGSADNIVDAVANILGLRDLKTVSLHSTLAELGMDSMTAVEIKQTLEREFEVFLTAQDIRGMTMARLIEIQEERDAEQMAGIKKEKVPQGFDMVVRLFGDVSVVNLPTQQLSTLADANSSAQTVIFMPGIEGVASVLNDLGKNLKVHGVCIQFPYENQADTIADMAKDLLPTVEENLSPEEPFHLVAYSFGAVVGLEVVSMLEAKGYIGNVTCIDGAPLLLNELTKFLEAESDVLFQTTLLCHLLGFHVPYDVIKQNKEKFFKCNTFEERIKVSEEIAGKDIPHTPEHRRQVAIGLYKRLKGSISYKPSYPKLQSKVKLYKPKNLSILNLPEDYGISELCANPVEVTIFEGNHVTILTNPDVAKAINISAGVEEFDTKQDDDKKGEEEIDEVNVKEHNGPREE